MFSMFSSVSGHFTKALVFGTLLPVLLFVAGAAPLVLFAWSGDLNVMRRITEQTTTLSVIVVACAGLLYNLNTSIIRFYEGYPWQESPVGRWRSGKHKKRLAAAKALQPLLISLRKQTGNEKNRPIQNALNDVSRVIANEYPGEELVLPTRLGNVIRNFEEYPRHQYGMSAIPLWPRLIAKIEKEYAAAIDEAKTSFDFLLNCSLLASVFSALVAVTGLLQGAALESVASALRWGAACLMITALGYAFYDMSLSAASAWGAQVKGAFDLYRGPLLKQLGYEQKTLTREEERTVWKAVSRQILYGDPIDGVPMPYAKAEAPASGWWDRLLRSLQK